MNKILKAIILTVTMQGLACGMTSEPCTAFDQLVKDTYNFKPAKLSDAERTTKSAAMDQVWETVKTAPMNLLPCLRALLEKPDADPFFLFDGSNLLVQLDPSPASKAIQVRNYAAAPLEDVDLRTWVTTLAIRGTEGFDTSNAAARWLSYPQAKYYLPEHGAYEVKGLEGALFIYGSMDEAKATPALGKIASQPSLAGRESALLLLISQATPESIRTLKQIDLTGVSEKVRRAIREMTGTPRLLKPRDKPKTTRAEFLSAFNGIVNGDWSEFHRLVEKVPDGEKDVVAVLTAEDMPLVRKVRRLVIANGNQHAIEYYETFTEILMTLMFKYEMRA